MAAKGNSTVTLMAGGDIGPVYEPTEQFAELIMPVWQQADLRIGQCGFILTEFDLSGSGFHCQYESRQNSAWQLWSFPVLMPVGVECCVSQLKDIAWTPSPSMASVEVF